MMKAAMMTGKDSKAKVSAVMMKVQIWDSHSLETSIRSRFQKCSGCFKGTLLMSSNVAWKQGLLKLQ